MPKSASPGAIVTTPTARFSKYIQTRVKLSELNLPEKDKLQIQRRRFRSLDDSFSKAMKSLRKLFSGEFQALSFENKLIHADCLRILNDCKMKLDSLELYGTTKIKEISTVDLKYLNIDYYVARTLEKTPIDPTSTSAVARMIITELSANKYQEFLSKTLEYNILSKEDTKNLTQLLTYMKRRLKLTKPPTRAGQSERRSRGFRGRRQYKVFKEYTHAFKLVKDGSETPESKIRDFELKRLEYHMISAWSVLDAILDEMEILGIMADGFPFGDEFVRTESYIPTPSLSDYLLRVAPNMGQSILESCNHELKINPHKPNPHGRPYISHIPAPCGKFVAPFSILPAQPNTSKKPVAGSGNFVPASLINEYLEEEARDAAKPEIPASEISEIEEVDNVKNLIEFGNDNFN